MLNHSKTLVLPMALCAALTAAPSSAENAIAASLGTTGVGVEFITPLSDSLNGRFVLQYGTYEADYDEDGIDYEGEWDNTNFGALLDWHPFSGGFRFTGGLVATNFGVDLTAKTSQASYEIGDSTYTGNLAARRRC